MMVDGNPSLEGNVTNVLIAIQVELSPQNFVRALAISTLELQEKCTKGEVFLSVHGSWPTGWDFDGDYYLVISNPEIVDPVHAMSSPATQALESD
eukprot:5921829-Amphidinium_carterae.1